MRSTLRLVLFSSLVALALVLTGCENAGPQQYHTVVSVVDVPGEHVSDPQWDRGSMVVDSQGEFAYVFNGSAVLKLDLATHQFLREYPLEGHINRLDDIDSSDSLVSVYNGSVTTIATDGGTQKTLFTHRGEAIGGAIFAQGFLYAPSHNARGVYAVPTDGSVKFPIKPYPEHLIRPYPEGGREAGPSSIAASPDGSKVVFGDGLNTALHVIRTSDNTVIATLFPVPLGRVAFVNNDIVAVVRGGGRRSPECNPDPRDGKVLLVDLTNPLGVPDEFKVASLDQVLSVLIDPAGTGLFLLHAKWVKCDGRGSDAFFVPEVIIWDVTTKKVTGRVKLKEVEPVWVIPMFEMAITPDGKTLLVWARDRIYFLE